MNAIEEESSVEKNIKERKELWKEYFPVGRKIAVWLSSSMLYLAAFSLFENGVDDR